jgi:hypothetical protein
MSDNKLALNLSDAIRLLDLALDYGRVLHRTGCNCAHRFTTNGAAYP